MESTRESAVLFVDDEPSVLSALQRLFQDQGMRLLFASGGDDALEQLENHGVQVVMSDYRMPGMDGAEFLRRVAERWPDTVRIMASGFADMAATVSAINDGNVLRFVAKPWRNEELILIVREGVNRFWQQCELREQALTTGGQQDDRAQSSAQEFAVPPAPHRGTLPKPDPRSGYRLAFRHADAPLILYCNGEFCDANDAAFDLLGDLGTGAPITVHPLIREIAERAQAVPNGRAPESVQFEVWNESAQTRQRVVLFADENTDGKAYLLARLDCHR